MKKILPFKIKIPPGVLLDLRQRLKNTRWPRQAENVSWEAGTDVNYLKKLVAYWLGTYDWRKHETAMNRFSHFKVEMDGIGIHFIHERGKGPNPFPLILTHGYPDSFHRFAKIIPMLTDPASFGGSAEDAFDVVVPDLPGYGFSDQPDQAGMIFQVNNLWARLMTDVLGYKQFGAHGGDWGSTVTEQLARSHPDSVMAIHLTDVPFWHIFQKPANPSPSEKKSSKETNNGCRKRAPMHSSNPPNPGAWLPG